MSKNKTPKIFQSKLFFIALLIFSSLLLISPFIFKVDPRNFLSLGLFGVALFNFAAAATVFIPIPGYLATGFAGSIYNPILVAMASALGGTLGEGVGFAFGYSTEKISNIRKHKIVMFIANLLHGKYGPLVIIVLAFIPNPLFDLLGVAAGISLYPLKKFLVLVFIGRFARDLIISFIGSRIA